MEIRVNEHNDIQLGEIYNPIELVAEKETLFIQERDGLFEIVRRPIQRAADGYTACIECGLMIPIGQVLCPSHLS
jgi:hypothetical protein